MVLELPALPYASDALSPHINAQTLEIHHGKHHNAYVVNGNKLIAGTEYAEMSHEDVIKATAGKADKAGIFNNAAQVWNHTFYWNSMKPGGGGAPTGAIAAKIAAFPTPPAAIATSGYQEPSLVFLLGRDLLLLDPTEAALFLIEAPGGLAIIEQRHQAAFLDAASQLKLGLARPVQLSGFNISKGQEVVILLYRTEIFDASVSKE